MCRFVLIFVLLMGHLTGYGQGNSSEVEQAYQDNEYIPTTEQHTELTLYNLNTISEQELISLHLLSPIQIENLLHFRHAYGYFISEAELHNINGFSASVIEELMQYSFIGPVPKKEDISCSSVHTKFVLGVNQATNQHQFKLKLTSNIGNHLSVGLGHMSSYGNPSFNGYLHMKKYKTIDILVLGNYRITFGQGLSLWNGYGFSSPFSIQKKARGIQGVSSGAAYASFKGIACTLKKKQKELSLFYSANEGINTMGSFYEHQFHHLKIGGIMYASMFSSAIEKSPTLYQQQQFHGHILPVAGIHYQRHFRDFQLFGEMSTTTGTTYHWLQGIEGKPFRDMRISVLYRRYQPNLYTDNIQPYAIGSPQGEEGILWAMQWAIHANWKVNLSTNYGIWEGITYRKDFPSFIYKQIGSIIYQPTLTWQTAFTYTQYKTAYNSSNTSLYMAVPIPHKKQQYKWELFYEPVSWLTLKSRIELATYDIAHTPTEVGVLFCQDAHLTFAQWSLHLRYALFDIPTYNTRIYAYENDLAYEMSVPAYYKNGTRYLATFSYRITPEVALGIRIAHTLYTPSLLEGISDERNKPSLKAQVRYTFSSKRRESFL